MGRIRILLGLLLLGLVGCWPSRASQSAGEIGCRPSEITISDETVGDDGFFEGSENWVAECMGRRFICTELKHRRSVYTGSTQKGQDYSLISESNVSCTEEISRPDSNAAPREPAHEPPVAGAGFNLGAKAEVAQAACESAGHQWQLLSLSQASCSDAAVSIGVPTAVTLDLCSGSVCRVTLVHQPEQRWLAIIAEVLKKLEMKYGAPGRHESTLPEDCRASETFVDCLKTRRARLRYGWSWGTGESLTLLVGIPLQGGAPAIRIIYAGAGAAPAGKVDANAL